MSTRRRAAGATALALTATVVLTAAAPVLPAPPVTSASGSAAWWHDLGAPAAILALVRLLGLVMSAYMALVGLVAAVAAATGSRRAHRLWTAVATPTARRIVVGTGLVAMLSTPGTGAAQPTTSSFRIRDLGPVEPAPAGFRIVDLGAVPQAGPAPPDDRADVDLGHRRPGAGLEVASFPDADTDGAWPARSVGASDDTWRVEAGDHLWHIAQETLSDHRARTDEASVRAYWLRLVALNRDLVGEDPDLIHPGQVIRLPPLAGTQGR